MAIADWIRERTEKRKESLLAQGYSLGYEDGAKGKARRFSADAPDKSSKNGKSD